MDQYCKIYLALLLGVLFSMPALAADFAFHGDLNNRFGVYTNQQGFFQSDQKGVIEDKDDEASFASIKYRLWTEVSGYDGAVKGVYAIEIGAVRFGRQGSGKSLGGGFSGDGVNVETRWAYTDFQLPGVDSKARFTMGLFPFKVNSFVWSETATGVQFTADNYRLAWVRGKESLTGSSGSGNWGDNNIDSLMGRYDFKMDAINSGIFALYQWQTTDIATADGMTSQAYQIKQLGDVEFDLLNLGIDGSWSTSMSDKTIFINWDLIYQNGSFDGISFTDSLSTITAPTKNYNLSAFLLHGDIGINFGKSTVTYTGWYASGDDDPNDNDFNAYITTDVDREDSIVLMEGGYTDDVYYTERPELFDKGFIMNKLAFDHQTTDKLKTGASILYMLAAEDFKYTDDYGRSQSQNNIGFELDAYASYMLYTNLELAINAGYLFAGDAMDRFEVGGANIVNGTADNDIFRTTARVRFKF